MILKINHDKQYEVRCMTDLFYPGIKPNENSENSDFILKSILSDNNKACETVIELGDKIYRSAEIADDNSDDELKRIIKQSFYNAASEQTGVFPPYGILTGIRPSKIASRLLLQLQDDSAAIKVLIDRYKVKEKKAILCLRVAKTEQIVKAELKSNYVNLYISIPFCPSRCNYCSFVSVSVEKSLKLIPEYLAALKNEISSIKEKIDNEGQILKTIYIGGGTPTVLSAEQINDLLLYLDKCFNLNSLDEVTIEAGRPDTIDAEKLKVMSLVNNLRISINPQTLSDKVLENIGRAHTAKQFFECFELARKSGFRNINVDIITGLPSDDELSFENTVKGILSLSPENITVHAFAVKRAAGFTKSENDIYSAKSEAADRMNEYISNTFSGIYEPYYIYRQRNTISNLENAGYARDNKICLYNIYMMNEIASVYGAGAGAVSKFINLETGKITRETNCKYPYEYLNRTKGNSLKKFEL